MADETTIEEPEHVLESRIGSTIQIEPESKPPSREELTATEEVTDSKSPPVEEPATDGKSAQQVEAPIEVPVEAVNDKPVTDQGEIELEAADEDIAEEAEETQVGESKPPDPISGDDGLNQEFVFEGEEGEGEYEEIEPEESIRSSEIDLNLKLDKNHLQAVFEEVYYHKRRAVRRRALLNRKVSEFYRRQQNYAVFNQESASVHKDYLNRYRALLLEMDSRLAVKKQCEIDSKNLILPLKQAIDDTKAEYTMYCRSFEKLFFDIAITLQGSASGKELKETTVQNLIRRMQNVRNLINVERLEFIKTENLVAEIEVKAKSLEDLGNGLRMVDFEQLRSETQSLSDKIEERNNELEKLRLRCNADTQILAHVREKDFMLHNIIQNQKDILKDKNDEVDYERERCNGLKIERDTYRKKHSDLSIECGLLDKPLLLRDYDITVEEIEKKKKEIAKLQMENEAIEKAVRKIAIILSEGELIKTDSQKFGEQLLHEISFMDAPIFPRIKKTQQYQ